MRIDIYQLSIETLSLKKEIIMFQGLLHTHSLLRWVLLITLVLAIISAFRGMFGKKGYTATDNKLRMYTVILTHVQLVLGLAIYFMSPMIKGALSDMKGAMANKALRFFTVEHTLMMVIAVVLITMGSAMAKKQTEDVLKHKKIAIWFTIALIIIFAAIPWPFRADIARALFPGA